MRLPHPSPQNGTALRILAVTALYAAAIGFAVVFSPANGFIHPDRLANINARE